ncbi:MAG: sigma 54-interacting transcriptional regulator [Methylovulum sp.]|uniref:sigma-54-dependent Fis family transcriptional regulator n=1 Tax=Methylovulum sp. TaxID=1916980 RepID=UPI00262F0D16|nr:sigma 54-interacting transcriptional regulator [Methylovulum sp.]MDD2722584.1 sigma 54-interacting transcriptional regulator [Methylovulum sp.]MDD5123111.1 sigma 54-interacting transcriptional regulator [Methylovulum sp.]
MLIDLHIHQQGHLAQESLLLGQSCEYPIFRPMQAWQWMTQTRSVPDPSDWVRLEVIESWHRCLEDYRLPLGNYAMWENYPIAKQTEKLDSPSQKIEALIKQLDHNFHVFLKEAGVMMMLTSADGNLLYALGEQQPLGSFMSRASARGANWLEPVLGNNGIGTAAELKKPIAFQGMEHYLSVLHPYTTVGYPLLDDAGQLLAVIGLVSSHHQESMNSLFAFLHLICVLVNTDLPLAKNSLAQQRVLEKIPFKAAPKTPDPSDVAAISETLATLVEKAVKLQRYKIPILITGESGVGKDHFVTLIKNAGPRKNAPLIAINCASIPHDLIESELFGYESGSFTGAKSTGKPGKFMLADTGILFLDEIGDMSFDLQSTLLRVLETSEFTPVGGNKPIRVDVQVIAATNVQLLEAVEAGRFRRDLYYRLNGAQIHLQALRERNDKKAIIHHILQRELNAMASEPPFAICPEVIKLFEQHPWPGNIRQLINVIRATLYTASSRFITTQDLPLDFIAELKQQSLLDVARFRLPITQNQLQVMSLSDWELHGIKTALKNCDGNISLTAKKLGITRTTLYKKMEYFGLNKTGDESLLYVAI